MYAYFHPLVGQLIIVTNETSSPSSVYHARFYYPNLTLAQEYTYSSPITLSVLDISNTSFIAVTSSTI